jgi:DNA-directed RNA polymerase specialized sigma24 family protein
MDTKKWLNRAYKIEQQIASKREQIDKWRLLAQRVTSNPQAVPVQGGFNESKLETVCVEIADIETEIEKQMLDLIRTKNEIRKTIEKVPYTNSRLLLENRYLNGYSWETIAEIMNYNVRHITKTLHPQALNDIEPYIPK